MAEDADQTIWLTVEHPTDEDDIRKIRDELQDTALAERYQIIVSSEDIDTISSEELKEAFGA